MSEISQDEIWQWVAKSNKIFIKKLASNDRSWADNPRNHQNGFYVPQEVQQAGFFPPLKNVNREKPHILMAEVPTFWPSTGEFKTSTLRHFSNKGTEMHFTRVPKEQFAGLTPASLLLGGKLSKPHNDTYFWFIVIDAASEEAEILESVFDLRSDFHYGLFEPKVRMTLEDELEELTREIEGHLHAGTLPLFIASVAKLPSSEMFAARAQQCYLDEYMLERLDPYILRSPGDAIMRISRDIEYSLYKRAELRQRAAEVIRIVTSGQGSIVSAIVRGFPKLDAIFLSASQHRKSRAGRSFERHIARLLRDGNAKFEEQAVTGARRPDFVLPGLRVLKDKKRSKDEALVLSAKTTLRERWKQIAMEKFNCDLFLATVDDRVSSDAIDDMQRQNICLVVPESLKKSDESSYARKGNVITFREFFDNQISKRPGMLLSCRDSLP